MSMKRPVTFWHNLKISPISMVTDRNNKWLQCSAWPQLTVASYPNRSNGTIILGHIMPSTQRDCNLLWFSPFKLQWRLSPFKAFYSYCALICFSLQQSRTMRAVYIKRLSLFQVTPRKVTQGLFAFKWWILQDTSSLLDTTSLHVRKQSCWQPFNTWFIRCSRRGAVCQERILKLFGRRFIWSEVHACNEGVIKGPLGIL